MGVSYIVLLTASTWIMPTSGLCRTRLEFQIGVASSYRHNHRSSGLRGPRLKGDSGRATRCARRTYVPSATSNSARVGCAIGSPLP
jgi:hypothetical protein